MNLKLGHLGGEDHLLLTEESVGPELFTEEAERSVVLPLVREAFQPLAAVFQTWKVGIVSCNRYYSKTTKF